MYVGPTNQSQDRSHDDLAISVGAQHQWFPEQQLILDDLHEIHLGVNYDLDQTSTECMYIRCKRMKDNVNAYRNYITVRQSSKNERSITFHIRLANQGFSSMEDVEY